MLDVSIQRVISLAPMVGIDDGDTTRWLIIKNHGKRLELADVENWRSVELDSQAERPGRLPAFPSMEQMRATHIVTNYRTLDAIRLNTLLPQTLSGRPGRCCTWRRLLL